MFSPESFLYELLGCIKPEIFGQKFYKRLTKSPCLCIIRFVA